MIRILGLIISLALAAPTIAEAQTSGAETQIVRELTEEGYWEIRITRTWLGRLRILAVGEQGVREIVIHPSTGVILRDYLDVSQAASDPGKSGQAGNSSTPGNVVKNGNPVKGGGENGDPQVSIEDDTNKSGGDRGDGHGGANGGRG